MNVKELREQKHRLESLIYDALRKFEIDSGCTVTHADLRHISLHTMHHGMEKHLEAVDLTIEL